MPAYWIARARVIDADRYWRYAEQVPAILARHGGKVLSRGGAFKVLEGTDRFARFVVIEFESMADAVACYESPEYQAARRHRIDGAGEAEIVLVEGGEFTSTGSLQAASGKASP